MPILEREIDVYPDDLLTSVQPSLNEESHWWAVYTRSRQ